MRHISIPSTLTDAAMIDWLHENCIDKTNHVKKVDYTPEQIQDFEHHIANNTNAVLQLEELKKEIGETIKNGTDVEQGDQEVTYLPKDYTIPPTKGLKALKANIEFLNEKIQRGHEEEVTQLFLIPYPEAKRVIAVNGAGEEYEEHSRDMTELEVTQFNTLFTEAVEVPVEEVAHKPKKQKKEESIDELFESKGPFT